MHKNIFIIGMIVLFVFSVLSPIVFGFSVRISNEKSKSSAFRDDGLMDSAWPMFHHDVRHTGRSQYGKSGNWFAEKWKVDIGSLVYSSPAIDKNGTIYIGSNNWYFYAINSNGTEKWRFKTGGGVSSAPAIAEDGTIYVGSEDGCLYAIYPNGTKKWSILIGDGWVYSSPVIDDNGIIYVTSVIGSNICAVYPNGTKKWDYVTNNWIYSSPVLDNNTVYCGSYDYYFYALYKNNGSLKWKFNAEDWLGDGAAISEDGIIYFGNKAGNFFALYPNGTRKWQINNLGYIKSIPAIAEDGNIIITTGLGYVYSINPNNGNENWRFSAQPEISASPAIDKYGIIYVGTYDGMFYALNPNGTIKWQYKTLDRIFPSAAISEDGTIYVGAHSDTFIAYLYAIEPIDDNPPEKPIISGPANGKPRTKYTYIATTNDIDGDNVFYFFDWGDGTNSGWTEVVPSGFPINKAHSWNWRGKYIVKVKAKDVYNMESDWETLVVTIPRSKTTNIDTIFIKLLKQFPMLQKLLKQLDFQY